MRRAWRASTGSFEEGLSGCSVFGPTRFDSGTVPWNCILRHMQVEVAENGFACLDHAYAVDAHRRSHAVSGSEGLELKPTPPVVAPTHYGQCEGAPASHRGSARGPEPAPSQKVHHHPGNTEGEIAHGVSEASLNIRTKIPIPREFTELPEQRDCTCEAKRKEVEGGIPWHAEPAYRRKNAAAMPPRKCITGFTTGSWPSSRAPASCKKTTLRGARAAPRATRRTSVIDFAASCTVRSAYSLRAQDESLCLPRPALLVVASS
jgi:hypothetical protein